MIPESPLQRTDHGLVPTGPGWFVLNARAAPWRARPGRGAYCEFEGFDGAADFAQLGINLTLLAPGEPMAMYHWERDQEDFLILAGEALAIVEGEERTLRAWDLLHCPPGTSHVVVGAGAGPCLVLAVGAREHDGRPDWGAYPVSPVASRHGAGVARETADPAEAYARFPGSRRTSYEPGWLPDC